MQIKVKSRDYHVSFKHESGPPSVMADKLTMAASLAAMARTLGSQRLAAAQARYAKWLGTSIDPAQIAEAREQASEAEHELRKLPTPEQAVQRALDKVDKALRLATPSRPTYSGVATVATYGLGRSARRPYLKRTTATIWVPIVVEKEGALEVKRPDFNDPKAVQIVASGETKCSDLDVYTREEGRAIALARAAVLAFPTRDEIVVVGIQAFPVTATRGRQAYWKECAELRPDLWPPAIAIA